MADVCVQARPCTKRGLEEPVFRSPKKALMSSPQLGSSPRASAAAQPAPRKRSAPFHSHDSSSSTPWRSPHKLHKAGSIEHVRPCWSQHAQVFLPPPGLSPDGGDMDVDEEGPAQQQSAACQGEQQGAQWGCMFGKLGLSEALSTRATPLYGMASDNKRSSIVSKPVLVKPSASSEPASGTEPTLPSTLQQGAAEPQQASECSVDAKRLYQSGYSHQLSLFFLRNQLK